MNLPVWARLACAECNPDPKNDLGVAALKALKNVARREQEPIEHVVAMLCLELMFELDKKRSKELVEYLMLIFEARLGVEKLKRIAIETCDVLKGL